MIELIKQLANEGFEVRIIEVKPKQTVTIATPMFEMPEAKKHKINSVTVGKERFEKVAKRINWKTINKIKEAKEDGLSSKEAANDLGLPLETVNKYWAK